MANANSGKSADDLTDHDKAIINRIFNPSLPEEELEETDRIEPEEIETESIKRVKDLEVKAVEAAERQDFDLCLQLLHDALEILPDRASLYNNRAQAYQLKGNVSNALEDLEIAINLSRGTGKVASQAYTQRGVIKKFQGDDDAALQDFKLAAQLGNPFARQQVVALNPYAALCNQMMSELVRKVKTGEA